jgi:serine/threonine-protein kinase
VEDDMADASSGRDPDEADLVGVTLHGGWQIRRHIGIGAMGQVYEAAHDDDGPARVAVKVLHTSLLGDREVSYRFRREAEILESIESPHVPRVFDRGKDPRGRPFMVMELIAGVELAKVVQARGTLPVPLALEVAKQVCRALAAAHRAGVVHRDLKPDNVMLCGPVDQPEVKLLDFSVSKVEDLAFTNQGALLGTPSYMPPEQARGDAITPRVDIYAVGAVLYEMLTGRPPFDSPEAGKVLAALLTETAPTPRSLAPNIPEKVEAIILRAIEKEASRRYPTADALEADLAFAGLPDQEEEDAPQTERETTTRASHVAPSSSMAATPSALGPIRAQAAAPGSSATVLWVLGGGFVAVALTMVALVFSDFAFPRWVAAVAWILGGLIGWAVVRAQARRAP